MADGPRVSRRAILATGAAGASALAGCAGVGDDPSDADGEQEFGYGGVPVTTDDPTDADESGTPDDSEPDDADPDDQTDPVSDDFGVLLGGSGAGGEPADEYGLLGYGAGGYGG